MRQTIPPADPGLCPIAVDGLFRDADAGRCLVDMALEGLSCLETPAAEPGLVTSTVRRRLVYVVRIRILMHKGRFIMGVFTSMERKFTMEP